MMKNNKWNFGTRIAACAALTFFGVGCGSDDDENTGETRTVAGLVNGCSEKIAGYYNLALVLDFDGEFGGSSISELAFALERSAAQAITEINAQGGVLGRSLGYIACSIQAGTFETLDAMTNVHGRIYHFYVPDQEGQFPVEMASMAILDFTPTFALSTQQNEYVHEVYIDSRLESYNAPLAMDFEGRETATMLYTSFPGFESTFQTLSDIFVQESEQLGIDADSVDLSSGVSFADALSDNPDAVYIFNSFGTVDSDLNQIRSAFDGVVYASSNFINSSLFETAQSSFISTRLMVPPSGGNYGDFLDSLAALGSDVTGEISEAAAYDSVYGLATALQAATDPESPDSVNGMLSNLNQGDTVSVVNNWSRIREVLAETGEVNLDGSISDMNFGQTNSISVPLELTVVEESGGGLSTATLDYCTRTSLTNEPPAAEIECPNVAP